MTVAVFILRRLLTLVVTLVASITAVFFILRLLPGDPAVILAGEDATAELVRAVRAQWDLDKPLIVQYVRYFENTLSGNMGRSTRSNLAVVLEFRDRLPYTIQLAVAAFAIGMVLGMVFGTSSALKPGSWFDTATMATSVAGGSLPSFWIGLLMIWFFGTQLRWLPTVGTGGVRHLILPAFTLSLMTIGVVARQARSGILETLQEDFIRTARAKGLTERTILVKHALRNMLIPLVTLLGLQFGYLLGGSVVIEAVFGWPGIGKLTVDSILARDYPVIQAAVLLFALTFGILNALVDISYAVFDPRTSA